MQILKRPRREKREEEKGRRKSELKNLQEGKDKVLSMKESFASVFSSSSRAVSVCVCSKCDNDGVFRAVC